MDIATLIGILLGLVVIIVDLMRIIRIDVDCQGVLKHHVIRIDPRDNVVGTAGHTCRKYHRGNDVITGFVYQRTTMGQALE